MKLSTRHNKNLNILYNSLVKLPEPEDFNQGRLDLCLIGQAAKHGILGMHHDSRRCLRFSDPRTFEVKTEYDVIHHLFGDYATNYCLTRTGDEGIPYRATWRQALEYLNGFICTHGMHTIAGMTPRKTLTPIQSMKVLVQLAEEIEALAKKHGVSNVKIMNIGQTSFKLNISL